MKLKIAVIEGKHSIKEMVEQVRDILSLLKADESFTASCHRQHLQLSYLRAFRI